MATKAFKSEKIDAIKAKAEKAQVAILTEYKGYTVEEITSLRRSIQKDKRRKWQIRWNCTCNCTCEY